MMISVRFTRSEGMRLYKCELVKTVELCTQIMI